MLDLVPALQLKVMAKNTIGPCPACKAEKRSESDTSDRRGPLHVTTNQLGVDCVRCNWKADSVSLVSRVLIGAELPQRDPRWRDLRVKATAAGLVTDDPPPARPTTVETTPTYPDLRLVQGMWAHAKPVAKADPDACAFLEKRGYWPPEQVDALDLVKILPPDERRPEWWPFEKGEKTRGAYRLLIRAYSGSGDLRSVHARSVLSAEEMTTRGLQRDKTRWPRGFASTGLLFANREGLELLRGRGKPGTVIVGEGLTGLLNASLHGHVAITAANGGWHALADAKWPQGAEVVIATDCGDKLAVGDKYAAHIRAALPDHVRTRRIAWPAGRDLGDVTRDQLAELVRSAPTYPAEESGEKGPTTNVLEAALEEARAAGDVDAKAAILARLIRAVDQLAALRRADETGYIATFGELRTVIGSRAGLSKSLTELDRLVKAAARGRPARAAPAAADVDPIRAALGALAEGLDLPPGLRVPTDYSVSANGVWRTVSSGGEERQQQVCLAPLLVTKITSDIDGAGSSVVLTWHDGRGWRTRPMRRSVALVARALAEQSAFDVPVSSVSAAEIVRYLEAWLTANAGTLPTARTSAVLGWRPEGFLLGHRVIGPDGPIEPPPITFSHDDPGTMQIADAYRAHGTWEGWCAAVRAISDHPKIVLALLGALCPPLMRMIPEASNFLLDFAGETSQGKTTALRVAASAWGNPVERDPDSVVWSWDASPTWIERAGACATDLPVILDDSKRTKPETVGRIVYAVAQGRGRGRGTITGLQATGTWRTVLLSTGEAPLTSYTQDGGAQARVLTWWGSPLEAVSADGAALARSVTTAVIENYGHAGPRFVAWLQGPGRREWVRERYQREIAALTPDTKGNAVAERAVSYLALLGLTATIASELGIPIRRDERLLEVAWSALVGATHSADKAAAAMRDLHTWAVANQSCFWGRHDVIGHGHNRAPRRPAKGFYGAWPVEPYDRFGITQMMLREQLEQWGYEPEAVLRSWDERGWLIRSSSPGDRHRTTQMEVDGNRKTRVVCIKRAHFEGGDASTE